MKCLIIDDDEALVLDTIGEVAWEVTRARPGIFSVAVANYRFGASGSVRCNDIQEAIAFFEGEFFYREKVTIPG